MISERQQHQDRSKPSYEMERLTTKSTVSADSLKSLINSVTSEVEERLLLQDSIDGIAKESEAFISYLYCMTSSDKRNKLLPAYRQFLKDMIGDVDTLVKQIGKNE
jgi:hypothetical protein